MIDALVEKLLEAREEKSRIIKALIKKYNTTLLIFGLNIPGIEKNKMIYDELLFYMNSKLLELFGDKVIISQQKESFAGNYYCYLISMDALFLKKKMIKFEESDEIGRLLDLDVFNEDGDLIKRSHFGYSGRKCFLCKNEAIVCRRLKKHSYEEMMKNIDNKILTYIRKRS